MEEDRKIIKTFGFLDNYKGPENKRNKFSTLQIKGNQLQSQQNAKPKIYLFTE